MADETLNKVNASIGVIAGVVGLVLPTITKLPESTTWPVICGSLAALIIPFLVPRSVRLVGMAHGKPVRYSHYSCWGITIFLVVALVGTAFTWTTLPMSISKNVGFGSKPTSIDLISEMKTSSISPPKYRLATPQTAFDEWKQNLGLKSDASTIAVVGVLHEEKAKLGSPQNLLVRLYPAQMFFSETNGPLPFFERVLSGWLLILIVFELFLVFLIPFMAQIIGANGSDTGPKND